MYLSCGKNSIYIYAILTIVSMNYYTLFTDEDVAGTQRSYINGQGHMLLRDGARV